MKFVMRALDFVRNIITACLLIAAAVFSLNSLPMFDYPAGLVGLCIVVAAVINLDRVGTAWRRLGAWYAEASAPAACATTHNKELVAALIVRLREKSRQKRIEAVVALVLVLISMALFAFAFGRTDYDASDPYLASLVGGIAQEGDTVRQDEQRIARIRERLQDANADDKPLVDIELQNAETQLEMNQNMLSMTKSQLLEMQTLESSESKARLVSSVTSRLALGVIFILLVQILVGLYRYSSRLEAFYEARADALTLATFTGDEPLADLAKVLMPDAIDFGRVPASPIEQVLRSVTAVAKEK